MPAHCKRAQMAQIMTQAIATLSSKPIRPAPDITAAASSNVDVIIVVYWLLVSDCYLKTYVDDDADHHRCGDDPSPKFSVSG